MLIPAIAGLLVALPAHADDTSLPAIVVSGARPIPGLEVPRDVIPSPVQTVSGETIRQSRALDVGDFMNRNLGSVHINETQGNPFQADVNYCGYTASPLLGTPQGLSVFVDGVRMNQAFGDVVSWDLIPRTAIKSMTLAPGSNPLFGLNTLGGALSIETKHACTQKREWRTSARRPLLPRKGQHGRLCDLQCGSQLHSFAKAGTHGPGQQPVRQALCDLGATGTCRIRWLGKFSGKTVSGGRRRIRRTALDFLCTWRAAPVLARCALPV
ncbi:Plug domain-containing protein [Noviherbaspirillum saxi]|uniref:Plug domain-containing protein n=1 Tax=Noviherbaspirillum saxi TaxID=2320863 RepID=A0A3A3FKJ6_9BURK|nr:Plug domain-containing protein [Noviherbaspirillum saxi]